MNDIKTNLQDLNHQLETIASLKPPPTLVAVSKTHGIEKLQQAIEAGQSIFGENYLQEAIPKIQQLPSYLQWHFIGPIQSNKTKEIAQYFSWVQTVDRLKIAKRLSHQRPSHMPALNILIQVNISDEVTKSGIEPGELLNLANLITQLPHLKLRGLMAIPAPMSEEAGLRNSFKKMEQLFTSLQQSHDIDTLSMGMSNDYAMAIEEGSTMIRVGTAIFGQRGK